MQEEIAPATAIQDTPVESKPASYRRRTFRWALWLGWQLDSNWTEPWLFAIYVLIKPLTSSLLLVCMYYAAREVTTVPPSFLPYMYIGNACFGLISAVMFGMAYAVLSDREHYRMLKYIYIAPNHLETYFVGRALSGAFQATLGGLINLAVGFLAFSEVREAFLRVPTAWGWLMIYLMLGVALLISLGLMLTALVLNMNRQGVFLSDGLAGVMYLVCGVVFPLSILPNWLSWLSYLLPPTYWLEGMRKALLGPPADRFTQSPLAALSHPQIAGLLFVSTLVFFVLGRFLFRRSERRAWRRGKFEEQSGA